MKFRIVLILATVLILGCKKEKNTTVPLLDYIPKNSSIVIKINDLNVFRSEIKNNDFINKLRETGTYKTISDKLKGLGHLQTSGESLLAFSEMGRENFEFTYVATKSPDLFTLDNVADKAIETLMYENKNFIKYTLEGAIFYSMEIDDKVVISSSQLLLENLVRNKGSIKKHPTFQQLYKVSNTGKSASVFVHSSNNNSLLVSSLVESSPVELSQFADWISLDLNMGQEYIRLNGLGIANDSLKNYVNLFKDTRPMANTTPSFAPLNANGILSHTFDDYGKFAKNQQSYLDRSTVMDTIFNTVEEIGFIYMSGEKAVILNTYGSANISEFLDGLRKTSFDYQGTEITELNSYDFLNSIFNPIIKGFRAKYYAILENAFIFTPGLETLKTIISNYKSGSIFEKSTVFKTAKDELADESSLLFVSDYKGTQEILKKHFSPKISKSFKDSKASKYVFAVQMVADIDFYHTNLIAQKIGKEVKNNTTSPLFNIQLDSDIATNPQFVTNHRTSRKEIVVQDQDNTLYLISTEGKVLWKKQLNGRIQGKILQVDIYKNGRLQLAFNTDNQFLILDRNGEEVKPFNKSFEGGNLNPLAVFDYEGKKNYRFVVCQGKKVFMYNSKAEIVEGFTYTTAESNIIRTPKHIRIGKKDYLVFALENGKLQILNRIGKVRTKVAATIDFSDNDVYLYKNKFSVSDKKGKLFQISEKGTINTAVFNLNKDHGMDATNKTLALMNDNTLSIKGKKVELELGVYTKPRIFYVYDKIYVSVTDIQNQKIYLFDSNAKSIQNFPIYGTSIIDLDDMDNDRKLELIAKDLENSLIVYKMN